MNLTETEKLLTIIQQLYPTPSKDFEQEAFEIKAKIWNRSLADYSYQDCALALEYWLNTEKFQPALVEFKKLVVSLDKRTNSLSAQRAWEIVDTAVRKFGSYNQDKAFETFTEPIKRAVRNIGGWQKICSTELGQSWDFLRKNFISVYEELEQDQQEQLLLPPQILKQLEAMQTDQPKLEGSK